MVSLEIVAHLLEHAGENRAQRGEIERRGAAGDDPDVYLRGVSGGFGGVHRVDKRRDNGNDAGGVIRGRGMAAHSGMFPCFLGGRLARLVRRARSALTTATRVAAGSMTPSSSPRSAARNGDATL